MASEYHPITDKEIQDKVRVKYRASIQTLKLLNFEELCFFSETARAFGLANGPVGLLGVLAALPREVSRIGKDLSASLFFPLLVSREYATYVCSFGLGTKFYTRFRDDTCVITANFDSPAIDSDREKLYKAARPGSIAEAWHHHRAWVTELIQGGKQINERLSFDEFAGLARKEDRYMLKPGPLTSAIFGELNSTLIAAIIFPCMLVAITLLFLLVPGILHAQDPTCWSVRNLDRPTLLQSLLILPACIAVSWFLARRQKDLYTVNGVGTKLHGQSPMAGSRGYIATKWIVILYLPILPVRSYQVFGEHFDAENKKYYDMEPLDHLHWEQIRETLWQFRWAYMLIALLWIGFSAWSILECS